MGALKSVQILASKGHLVQREVELLVVHAAKGLIDLQCLRVLLN